MYRILIVDDEVVEREVIRFLLGKYDFPFIASEATNGKEALAMLEQKEFDVLFTDIKMPFVDGLELAKQVRQLYPGIQIVFFSGYDDFEYAKKALSLRIVNYILKPVKAEEFQKTISDVLDQIHSKEERNREKEETNSFVKSHVVLKLINGAQPEQLKDIYSRWDCSFVTAYHRLLLIQLEGDFFGSQKQETDFFSFADLQQLLPGDCDCINLNPSQNLLLFFGRKHHFKWYQDLADQLALRIQKLYCINCYIAISNTFSEPGEISKAYTEAEQALLERFFFKNISTFGAEVKLSLEASPENDDILLKQLQKDIQFKDSFSLKQHMSILLNSYNRKKEYSHVYIRYLCTNVLKLLLDYLPKRTLEAFDEYARVIQSSNRFSEIESILQQLTDEVAAEMEMGQQTNKHAILLAKQYIHNHYSDNLSLDILSENMHLSPRYLSALFIDEEGIGINRYIKNVRMQKAQELLLGTNLKISDICSMVGYSNLSYFCKSFSKDFGVTPEKFRSTHPVK